MQRKILYPVAIALAGVICLLPATGLASPAEESRDIVSVAVESGQFETLVAAVKAAGLVGTLQGPGPYTVFAPTDEAFARLPEGTVESLLQDKEKLTRILTYHVVSGEVMASQVVGMNSAPTLQGQSLTIETSGGGVQVDDANVVATDVQASNGVIHVIDRVLMPSDD